LYDPEYAEKYRAYARSEIGEKIVRLRSSFILTKIQKGRFLDFGCGTGNLVQHLEKNSNLEMSGWDINPSFGSNDPKIFSKRFDAVSFCDSLEHLKNPRGIIEDLNAKHLFIIVPSLDDIQIDRILEWRHYKPQEHLHYYFLESLTTMLEILGYKVLDHHYSESLLRHSGGRKNILTVYAKLEKA
jgi:SAM-dependent methyltransferase